MLITLRRSRISKQYIRLPNFARYTLRIAVEIRCSGDSKEPWKITIQGYQILLNIGLFGWLKLSLSFSFSEQQFLFKFLGIFQTEPQKGDAEK